jgi:hypothetical protein
MTLLAATATAADRALTWGLLAAAAALWLAGYLLACLFWPFTACRRCEGAGRHRSPSGRAWRRCRRCRGTGERLRLGRRVWNAASRDRS